jgi:hypothetical protein
VDQRIEEEIMAKEYEVTSFKPRDFQDNYGNTWCDMALAGVSEPVVIVLKDSASVEVGKKLWGYIVDKESSAGLPYLKFIKEPQEGQTNPGKTYTSSTKYDSDGQRQGMAIKAAAEYITKWADKKLTPTEFSKAVMPYATVLYEMTLKHVEVKSVEASEPVTGQDEVHEFDVDDVDVINLSDIPF